MKKKALLVIGFGLVLTGCSHVQPAANQTPPSEVESSNGEEDTTKLSPTQDDGNQDVVNYALSLKNFSFNPALIEAEPGETVKVKLTNSKGLHDFTLDELDVKSKLLNEGEEVIIEITIPAGTLSGTEYEFYCSVGNHRQLGMVGVLRVK